MVPLLVTQPLSNVNVFGGLRLHPLSPGGLLVGSGALLARLSLNLGRSRLMLAHLGLPLGGVPSHVLSLVVLNLAALCRGGACREEADNSDQ